MIKRIFALTPAAALSVLIAACSPQDSAGDNERINKQLVNMSERLNKHLPDMADENTVLEATSGGNRQFTYYYTLLNYSADKVDTGAFERRMKPALLKQACASGLLEPLISKGATIRYVYADKDRQEFAMLTVSPAECGDAR